MPVNIITRLTNKGKRQQEEGRKLKDCDARYHVRWSNGRDVPVIYLGAYKTRAEAEDRKKVADGLLALDQAPTRNLLDQRRLGSHGSFSKVAQAWLDSTKPSKSTRKSKQSHINRFARVWKNAPAKSIDRAAVQEWIDGAEQGANGSELMGSTITLHLATLKTLLRDGAGLDVAWFSKLVIEADPLTTLDLPNKARRDAARARLSPVHNQVFDHLEHGGLRIGEVCDLTVGQIDNVHDQLMRVGTKGITRTSKKRPRIVRRLEFQPAWILQRPEGAPDDQLVFPREVMGTGGRTFRDALTAALEDAGLEVFTPHDLRHLHATRLNHMGREGSGLSQYDCAKRLGHSQQLFERTYTHDLPPD